MTTAATRPFVLGLFWCACLSAGLAAQIVVPQTTLNHPPIAVAGHDQAVGTLGFEAVDVTLYGAASRDPDGDPLTFAWHDERGDLVGSTAVATVRLLPGSYIFARPGSEGRGATASDSVNVIVASDRQPPIVIAPPDITVGITTDTGARPSDDEDLAAFLANSHA